MTHFKLIGHPTLVFKVVRFFDGAGYIPCVVGHTLDGKRQTVARIAGVEGVEAPR